MEKIEITASHVRIGDEIYSTPNISKVAVKSFGFLDGLTQVAIDRQIADAKSKWRTFFIALAITCVSFGAGCGFAFLLHEYDKGIFAILCVLAFLISFLMGVATFFVLCSPGKYEGRRKAAEIFSLRIESNNGGRDLLLDLSKPYLEQVRDNIIKAMASSGSVKYVMNYDNSTNTYHKDGDHTHNITVNHYDYGVKIKKYDGFSEEAMDQFKDQVNTLLSKFGTAVESDSNPELCEELRTLNSELNEESPSKTKLSKILTRMKPIAEGCGHVANVQAVGSLLAGFFGLSIM